MGRYVEHRILRKPRRDNGGGYVAMRILHSCGIYSRLRGILADTEFNPKSNDAADQLDRMRRM